MTSKAVIKRIEALEKASKSKNIPTIIIGYWNSEHQWEVKEIFENPEYHENIKAFQDMRGYKPPEEFDGVYLLNDVGDVYRW